MRYWDAHGRGEHLRCFLRRGLEFEGEYFVVFSVAPSIGWAVFPELVYFGLQHIYLRLESFLGVTYVPDFFSLLHVVFEGQLFGLLLAGDGLLQRLLHRVERGPHQLLEYVYVYRILVTQFLKRNYNSTLILSWRAGNCSRGSFVAGIVYVALLNFSSLFVYLPLDTVLFIASGLFVEDRLEFL